jgi:hypothetical protein
MVLTSLRLIHCVAVDDIRVKTTAADIVNFSKYIIPEINIYYMRYDGANLCL